jgi:hypothetical protein
VNRASGFPTSCPQRAVKGRIRIGSCTRKMFHKDTVRCLSHLGTACSARTASPVTMITFSHRNRSLGSAAHASGSVALQRTRGQAFPSKCLTVHLRVTPLSADPVGWVWGRSLGESEGSPSSSSSAASVRPARSRAAPARPKRSVFGYSFARLRLAAAQMGEVLIDEPTRHLNKLHQSVT